MATITIFGTGNMGTAIKSVFEDAGATVQSLDSHSENPTIEGDIVVLAVPYPALASIAEQYGDQPCPFLEAECWYDGSGLAADVVLAEFFDRGEIAVWEALQARYDDLITERNPIMSEEPTSAAADDITDAGDQTPIPVPTLREQIETHLWYAHDTDNTTALVHLAIAAGIGLASTTLDDISDQNDARDAAAQQFTNYPISALRGAL